MLTVNSISVALTYPSIAISSCITYVSPSINPCILCGSFPDTHLSTMFFVFVFVTIIVAPSSSSPAISFLLISTILSIISIFCVSLSLLTVNSTSVAITYPSGAYSSCKVYVSPSTKFLILCASLVEVHSSTMLPSLSNTFSSAPSISSPPMSFLVISTILSIITTFCVSFVFSTLNLTSVALTYPSGAKSSLNVYSFPTVKPSIVCVLFEEVHLSITFPFSSITDNSAPSNSLSPVIVVFEISTSVVSLTTSLVSVYTFVVVSFCVNLTSYFVSFNTNPSSVLTSCSSYVPIGNFSTFKLPFLSTL